MDHSKNRVTSPKDAVAANGVLKQIMRNNSWIGWAVIALNITVAWLHACNCCGQMIASYVVSSDAIILIII